MSPTRSELRPDPAAPAVGAGARWWSRLRLPLILVAALALAGYGLRGRFPDPRDFLGALTGADYWWVTLAVALPGTYVLAS